MALHLPLQSLFRCRAVSKLWRDVIDSPSFRKLHTLTLMNKEEEDETVYLHLKLDYEFGFLGDGDVKVSITKLDNGNGKSSILNIKLNEGFSNRRLRSISPGRYHRAVKGLICFNLKAGQPIAICNPFLCQVKILPLAPICISSKYKILYHDVVIGFDGEEFYKVVEVVFCRFNYANLYCRRTDSWRELGGGGGILDQIVLAFGYIINVSCYDSQFAHWYALTSSGYVILTFDMKNEAFRATKLDVSEFIAKGDLYGIVAKEGGCSFILIVLPERSDESARIYESSISICEEEGITRKLSWNHVMNFGATPFTKTYTFAFVEERLCGCQDFLEETCGDHHQLCKCGYKACFV